MCDGSRMFYSWAKKLYCPKWHQSTETINCTGNLIVTCWSFTSFSEVDVSAHVWQQMQIYYISDRPISANQYIGQALVYVHKAIFQHDIFTFPTLWSLLLLTKLPKNISNNSKKVKISSTTNLWIMTPTFYFSFKVLTFRRRLLLNSYLTSRTDWDQLVKCRLKSDLTEVYSWNSISTFISNNK